jgi:hypothetical protein
MNEKRWRAEPGVAPSVLLSARLVLFQATGKATRNHNIEEEDTDFALMIGYWYKLWMALHTSVSSSGNTFQHTSTSWRHSSLLLRHV